MPKMLIERNDFMRYFTGQVIDKAGIITTVNYIITRTIAQDGQVTILSMVISRGNHHLGHTVLIGQKVKSLIYLA